MKISHTLKGALCCLMFLSGIFLFQALSSDSALSWLEADNIVWQTQSRSSHESMPCGGGDIGMNVWVENGELLFYFSRSGSFDENNCFLKSGRVRVSFEQPLDTIDFKQMLNLPTGRVEVQVGKGRQAVAVQLWTDVYKPVIHVEVRTASPQRITAAYESWRYQDRLLRKNESFANSYKWAPPKGLKTTGDKIELIQDAIVFCHINPAEETIFDVTVAQQGMNTVKDSLFNPLANLISGGVMSGENFVFADTLRGVYLDTDYKAWRLSSRKAAKKQHFQIALSTLQGTEAAWQNQLYQTQQAVSLSQDKAVTLRWWQDFWNRSYIHLQPDSTQTEAWKVGRNYQLFRYQLACNAYGTYPTKFNGGLFTFDPVYVDKNRPFTPDFRNWGGGTFTAQNQRLLYFPMLKSGDFDMMIPQFDFYKNSLKNAEWRSRFYWQHEGACFTEQIENFALPNPSEYGWKRPDSMDKGIQYNKWLEYQWDTSLEFCYMILEAHRYSGMDISEYIPLIESCLSFFDEHYRMLAEQRGEAPLDENGHLKLFPGSACETYKQAYNASSTVAALQRVISDFLQLDLPAGKRTHWQHVLQTIPPLPLREVAGKQMIAPAVSWGRVNNVETPQLYPVYPWRLYGPASSQSDKEIALNTYYYDEDVQKFYSHVGWKQYNIFAACLGQTDEAEKLSLLKFKDAQLRFPTFWGPGFDWTPDHNWGGSAMIGLQEMLLQTAGDSIYLFPAWPASWDVSFKLCAPDRTVISAELKNGRVVSLTVSPEERRKNIILMNFQ